MADLTAAQQRHERALRLDGAAAALREAADMVAPVEFRQRHERSMADARSALGQETANAAWAEGHALALSDMLTEALAGVD